MTLVDISELPDELYTAYVAELNGIGARPTRPAPAAPLRFNRRSIARVAWLMANGHCESRVIGDWRWQGADAPDIGDMPNGPVPRRVKIHGDLLGHTEVYRGYKLGFRLCAVPTCDSEFVVRRAASVNARWPATCGDDCRREWSRIRKARQRGCPRL